MWDMAEGKGIRRASPETGFGRGELNLRSFIINTFPVSGQREKPAGLAGEAKRSF
jgi:hypothetical protein